MVRSQSTAVSTPAVTGPPGRDCASVIAATMKGYRTQAKREALLAQVGTAAAAV